MKLRIFTASLVVVGLIALTGCDSSKPKATSSAAVESLTLGISDPRVLSSLIWVAEDRGYFAQHGLKVNIKWYESGLAATKDLLAGRVDLATATEFVAARYILEESDLRIITSICESDDMKLVARKDHGITELSDIRHKRIGVLRGSGGEFFLDLLMALHDIPSENVTKVDLQPSEQAEALSNGDVDAVIFWEPYVSEVTDKLGTNAASWAAQSGQNYYWLLLGTEDTVGKRPSAIKDFVACLVSAEEFIASHREEARRIVVGKLGSSHIESLWPGTKFSVGLDHHLVLAMEAEMRWKSPDLQTDSSNMPDIFNFIYLDALQNVKPKGIKILH